VNVATTGKDPYAEWIDIRSPLKGDDMGKFQAGIAPFRAMWQMKKKRSQTPKDKQRVQSQSTRLCSGDKPKQMGPVAWPVEIPEFTTMLHLEFDYEVFKAGGRYQKFIDKPKRIDTLTGTKVIYFKDAIPNTGECNKAVSQFMSRIALRYNGKVKIVLNNPGAIKEYTPTGEIRPDAFEVTNVEDGKTLHSTFFTGAELVPTNAGDNNEAWKIFTKKLDEIVKLKEEARLEAKKAAGAARWAEVQVWRAKKMRSRRR